MHLNGYQNKPAKGSAEIAVAFVDVVVVVDVVVSLSEDVFMKVVVVEE